MRVGTLFRYTCVSACEYLVFLIVIRCILILVSAKCERAVARVDAATAISVLARERQQRSREKVDRFDKSSAFIGARHARLFLGSCAESISTNIVRGGRSKEDIPESPDVRGPRVLMSSGARVPSWRLVSLAPSSVREDPSHQNARRVSRTRALPSRFVVR